MLQSWMWADTNWVYQEAFQLTAGDCSEVCQMLQVTTVLYGKKKKNPQAEPLLA